MKSKYIQYYVEGEDEEKLIRTLKTDLMCIKPGKVQKFNVVDCELTDARLASLRPKTMVVLIFDTDTGSSSILAKNLKKLKGCPNVSEIITIPQVPNLEGELIRSCNVKGITELLNSQSRDGFKTDFIHVTNLKAKLNEHKFSIRKLWTGKPKGPYKTIENEAERIKIIK